MLDPAILRPSGAILGTQLGLAAEIESEAVPVTGLDPTILDLLVRLDLSPDRQARATHLCSELNLSAAHMSRTIDRAESDGLIERRTDPTDRRARIVTLTPAGDDVLGRFAPALHGVLRRVVHDVLTPQEIDVLVGLLERIRSACDASTVQPAHHEESSHA